MKTLVTILTALLLSFSSFAQQTVNHVEDSDSTYTLTISNTRAKTVASKMRAQISKKNLLNSPISWEGVEISVRVDTVEYISSNGKTRTSKTTVYTLGNNEYTKLGALKKALPMPTSGIYTINNNHFDFNTNSMTLKGQSLKQLVTNYMYTINVRTSKENPVVTQSLTILDKTFEIKKYSRMIEYKEVNNPNNVKEYRENVYSVNGVEFSKISEVKSYIKAAFGL